MRQHDDEFIRQLHAEVSRRQVHVPVAKPIGEVISGLLARRGYAQAKSRDALDRAWTASAGEWAPCSRPGNLRRGVLEIMVASSGMVQELSFRKSELLDRLRQALPDTPIRDLRFKAGIVE